MKKLSLLFIAALACSALWAQSSNETKIRERIYIQTDKDNYLSGELVWMKLLTTDEKGIPISFSKVGYVELVDETQSCVQTKIDLTEGIGSGTLIIPANLPTGYYRLVGYTRYMQNEGAGVFFEKWIGIVNPTQAEVTKGSSTLPLPDETSGAAANSIQILSDKTYSARSEVRLQLSNIPEDIHSLSVSVTSRDLTGSFASSGLNGWKNSLQGKGLAPVSNKHEVEYEGHSILGKLISTDTGEAAGTNSSIIPIIAFPGDGINIFSGKNLPSTGDVYFYTARTTGFNEVVTSLQGNERASYRIDVESPFTRENISKPLPSFPLDRIDREAMLAQSLSLQLQYSYLNDSLNRTAAISHYFLHQPDRRYVMEEWTRFATMQEVVTEFITSVRFTRDEGKRYLSVADEKFLDSRSHSLVLVDGIPLFDHDIIYEYNPLLLKRIDVFLDRYILGNRVFNGIIALYTENNNYPELRLDPFTQILPYEGPQPHRIFYAPDHSGETERSNRLPDYRHTLYWDADVETDNEGGAVVSFYASDLTGDYQVLVEGITDTGEIVQAVYPIEVR